LAVDGGIDVADRELPIVFKARTQEVLFESDLLDHAAPWLFPAVVFCTVFWLKRING
jgi:hypothetical protein